MRVSDRMKSPQNHCHVDDQEVLQFVDGELAPRRAAEIRQHFEECWSCRTRLMDFQNAVSRFVHFQQTQLDDAIPPTDGPLAQFRARLNAVKDEPRVESNAGIAHRRLWALGAVAAFAICVLSLAGVREYLTKNNARVGAATFDGSKPIAALTPGEALRISVPQVCSSDLNTPRLMLPASLRTQVFRAYGMAGVREQDFEVDYLITPDLGGTDTLRNLWPEPYYNTVWNAHVKDQLEVRLRDLVCSGSLDLSTAQRDLSSDWIAAYRKYFKSETPVGTGKPVALLFAMLNRP